MRRSTIIAITYFILMPIFVSVMIGFSSSISDAIAYNSENPVYVDRLTEHNIKPVNEIVAIGNDSVLIAADFIITVDVHFVADKKLCRVAYPEDFITVKQNNGRLEYGVSETFLRKRAGRVEYKFGPKGDVNLYQRTSNNELQYEVKHVDGSKETITETQQNGQKRLRIRLYTVPGSLNVVQGENNYLQLQGGKLQNVTAQNAGGISIADNCTINKLHVTGSFSLKIGNTTINDLEIYCRKMNDSSLQPLITLSTDSLAYVGKLLIKGYGQVSDINEAHFGSIVAEPDELQGGLGICMEQLTRKMQLK